TRMIDHRPDRTARAQVSPLKRVITWPLLKSTINARSGLAASVVADQWKLATVGPNTVWSMHGLPEPHPGAPRSAIPASSSITGSRQSQCPAKHPLVVVAGKLAVP